MISLCVGYVALIFVVVFTELLAQRGNSLPFVLENTKG